MVGDDLGSENFMLAQARLEFLNIPLLKTIGMKTFTYAEMAFYPPFLSTYRGSDYLFKNIRTSVGFGIALPVNQMISILVYYNACNFNTQSRGDFERHNIINVNLGFF